MKSIYKITEFAICKSKRVTLSKAKGFTLIELLLFMGLFSIVMFILLDIFTSLVNTKLKTESSTALHLDSRFILQKTMNDLNRAQFISNPILGNTSSTLQFTLYGIPQTYRLQNNNFELVNDLGTTQLNSYDTNVTQLTFSRLGNVDGKNSIKINFTLQSKIIQNTTQENASYQTVVGIR